VTVEIIVLGLVVGLGMWFVAWRLGVKPRPWRESVAWVLLYAALTLAIKASGVVGGTESITIAFLGASLLVGAWNRFAHRRANEPSQRI
jgi:uncharacterized membrane protein